MTEADFIARLRTIATDPAARGLADDTALLGDLVLTHDMIVEGVHFLPDDTPQDIAWKLVAVNLSDLAAKGAAPLGVLLGYSLSGDAAWDAAFVAGIDDVLRRFDVPLLGGDTVRPPAGAPRSFGLTAIGRAPATGAPARSGVRPGDQIWVTGTIGNAGVGLAMRLGEIEPAATCMQIALMLEAVPLSAALLAVRPDVLDTRLAAATAGDDYQLLFAADPGQADAIRAHAAAEGVAVTAIGHAAVGAGLLLTHRAQRVALPERLGFAH